MIKKIVLFLVREIGADSYLEPLLIRTHQKIVYLKKTSSMVH